MDLPHEQFQVPEFVEVDPHDIQVFCCDGGLKKLWFRLVTSSSLMLCLTALQRKFPDGQFHFLATVLRLEDEAMPIL